MGSVGSESKRVLPASPLEPAFTQLIIDSMGPKTSPRMREVMIVMIKYVHAFVKECNLNVDEWHAGMALLNETGKLSNDRVNHMQILMDCIGVETLVTLPQSPIFCLLSLLTSNRSPLALWMRSRRDNKRT